MTEQDANHPETEPCKIERLSIAGVELRAAGVSKEYLQYAHSALWFTVVKCPDTFRDGFREAVREHIARLRARTDWFQ